MQATFSKELHGNVCFKECLGYGYCFLKVDGGKKIWKRTPFLLLLIIHKSLAVELNFN